MRSRPFTLVLTAERIPPNKRDCSESTEFSAIRERRLCGPTISVRCSAHSRGIDGDQRFVIENGASSYAFNFLGLSGGHHSYSHHGTSQANYDALEAIEIWEMQQLAYLISQMKSVQEPGGTLLDNSVIFLSSEISDGDRHNHTNMPVIVAGRGRGALSPGRHVRFDSEVPVGNLFISLAAACGVTLATFGDNATGPCPGLTV